MNTKAQTLASEIAPDEKGYGPAIRKRLADTLADLTAEIEVKDTEIKNLQSQLLVLTSSNTELQKEAARLQAVDNDLLAEKKLNQQLEEDKLRLEKQVFKLSATLDKAANTILTYRKSPQLNPDVVLRTLLSLARSKDFTKE